MTGDETDGSEEAILQGVPTADFHDPRNDLSHWYEKLRRVDVPTPDTRLIPVTADDEGRPDWETHRVMDGVGELGGEAFVRGGYTSAAIQLHDGSHIRSHDTEEVGRTLMELVSQHVMMQMPLGDAFVLREWLDLDFCHYARATLHPEVRVFVADGDVLCHHPRLEGFDRAPGGGELREAAERDIARAWPADPDSDYRDHDGLEVYAERVADAFEGSWSVDFVMDTNGDWYCTDMALNVLHYREDKGWLNMSEHASGCEHNLEEQHASDLEPPEEVTA